MADYIFRKATDADMPMIMDMQVAVFHGEQGIPAEDIKMSKKDHQQWFCVEQNGEIIGSVAGWMEENKTHMGRFVIRPDLRRQGIGRKLVRLAFETLMEQGVEEFFMEGRDATVKLICSFGGVTTGDPFPFYNGNVTPIYLHRDNYIPEKERL